MPSTDDLEAFVESRYTEAYRYSIPPAKLNILAAVAKPGDRVLDLGCETGLLGERVVRSASKADLVAIDLAHPALKLARHNGLTVVRADVSMSLPLAGGVFDLVYAVDIIEHLIDTDGFLQEIRRALAPAGRLVPATSNAASLGRRVLLAAGRNPHLECAVGGEDAGHVRYFLASTLRTLCARNGFEVLSIKADYVNLDNTGRRRSARLASLFPTLGADLITVCRLSPG